MLTDSDRNPPVNALLLIVLSSAAYHYMDTATMLASISMLWCMHTHIMPAAAASPGALGALSDTTQMPRQMLRTL